MLPKLLTFLAVTLLTLAGFSLQVWGLWGIKKGDFIDDSRLKIKATAKREQGMSLQQVVSLHLFGNAADKPPVVQVVDRVLPKTELRLLLVGAITDSDPTKASALITAIGSGTRRYYVGDAIPGDAVLYKVDPATVVLKRANRYETLSFPKGEQRSGDQQDFSAFGSVGLNTGNSEGESSSMPFARRLPPITPPNEEIESRGLTLRERLQRRPNINQ